jgi:hypothetical protein
MVHVLKILDPYHKLEAISIPDAAEDFAIPARTLRRWCVKYRIGRRIGGYKRPWALSRVALLMVVDRKWAALDAYLRGVRKDEPVVSYFRAAGLEAVLGEFAAREDQALKN